MFKVISPELASAEAGAAVLQRLALYQLQGFIRSSGIREEK
jgi:hypothetical protein